MTVIELKDALNKLIKDMPNTANDQICLLDIYSSSCDIYYFDEISIEWDLNSEGRYICLK